MISFHCNLFTFQYMVFHNYILSTCTYTIPLIFTFLAGIIFTPLFTTFSSCFVIIFLKKSPFSVKYMVLHLMLYDFLSRKKCFLASTATLCSSLFFIICHTLCMALNVYEFLKLKVIFLKLSIWTASWSFVRWPLRFTSSSHFLQV